ncbi:MAG: TadE family type IV pilus minor pilin [Mycobacterium sp.]
MAVASLVAVLVLCVSGLTAVAMQIRCIDAAREAARLAARGDGAGTAAAGSLAPAGAAVELRREGAYVVARVSGRSPVLPGIVIVGEAVSVAEPGQ